MRNAVLRFLVFLALSSGLVSAQTAVGGSSVPYPVSWEVWDYAAEDLTVGGLFAAWGSASGDPDVTILVREVGETEAYPPDPRLHALRTVKENESPKGGETIPEEGSDDMTVTVVLEPDSVWDILKYLKASYTYYWGAALVCTVVLLAAGYAIGKAMASAKGMGD